MNTRIFTSVFGYKLIAALLVAALAVTALPVTQARAAACTSTADGAWSAAATWAGGGCTGALGVPAAGDDVTIANAVTVGATITQTGSVTINSGGSLTIINVPITFGALTINNGGTVSTIGLVTVTGATNITGTINFSANSKANIFAGDVTLNSGAVWNETINNTPTFSGSLINNASTFFTNSTGTYTFNGAGKTIGGTTTTSIPKISITGTYTNDGSLTVITSFDVTGTLTNNGTINTSTLTGAGGVIQGTTGILNFSGSSITPTLTASAVGNTVNYNGGGQTIKSNTTYYHFTLSGSGTKTPNGPYTVNGTLTIELGATLDESTRTLTMPGGSTLVVNGTLDFTNSTGKIVSGASGTTTLTMGDLGLIRTADSAGLGPGPNSSPIPSFAIASGGSWNITSLATNGTVEYYLTGTQPATDLDYNNLTITNTGAKTWALGANRIVKGNVTINSGAPLILSGAQNVTVKGNWSNDGTFTPGAGTVTFNGSSAQTMGGSSATGFNNLTISNASGVGLGANATVNGTLTLTSGALGVSTNTLTLNSVVTCGSNVINSSATGTVSYALGSAGQNVCAGAYGNLTFNNFNKTLASSGTIGIAGTFTSGSATGHTITGSTVNFNGSSGAQTIPAFTFNNLSLNNSSGASLSGNVTVNGALTFTSGRITTGANTLILGSSGSVSGTGAGKYVYGKFQKPVTTGSPTVTFEVGGASNYAPVSVVFNNVTSGGTLTGSTTDGQHPDFSNSGLDASNYINRYWTLTQSGLAFTAYAATFNFVAGDYVGSPTPGSMIIRKFDSGVWISNDSFTSTATATSATGTGFTSFSDFAIGNDTIMTPVTLSYFKAERNGDSLQFNWSTATESGNIGFNLYAVDGTRLNAQMIPSQKVDSLNRLDYSFRADAAGDEFYIDDVNLLGQADRHGPFTVGQEYGSRVDENKIDWNAIRIENGTSQGLRQEALSPDLLAVSDNPTSLNLKVNQTGLYRVTYEILRDAGLDLAGIASARITLTNRGQELPIYVRAKNTFGPGSFIEFYGQALDTIYTDTNIYTLQISRKPIGRIPSINAQPGKVVKPPVAYAETLVVNHQRAYANYAPGSDAWYDTEMLTFTTSKSWDFPFQINGLANPASTTLEMVVWGVTDWPQKLDHHLRVSLNGVPLADEIFDGLVEKTLKLNLPAGALREGLNTLQLTLPGDTGVEGEVVALDKFSVTYPRFFQAQDGRLTFTTAGSLFQVTNLPGKDVIVYRKDKNGLARLENVRVQAAGGAFTATFAGTSKPATYLVTTSEAMYAPNFEAVRQRANLNYRAQYLIISHPDFIAGIQPLVQARQAQGYTVSVVDVTDLYTQYSYGIFDPQAIQKYIAYAAKKLGTKYVLLVGGDTYDYRNYLGVNSLSFIPSLYARTGVIANFVPADPLYADLNQDNVPDLAIGRFPVRSTAELDLLVNKTLVYGGKNYGQTSAFASDLQDGSISFKTISDNLAGGLPSGWSNENIHLDEVSVTVARSQLIAAMNRGTALINFTGHSGPQEWTFSNLFNIRDAAALTNFGKPFVVVQWGCWNNYYVDPVYNYLVQSFLFSGDQGAAAVLGATTLADSTSEEMLGQLLMPRLATPGVTIGQALQAAKSELAQSQPGLLDVLLGWSLMGDPTLVVVP